MKNRIRQISLFILILIIVSLAAWQTDNFVKLTKKHYSITKNENWNSVSHKILTPDSEMDSRAFASIIKRGSL